TVTTSAQSGVRAAATFPRCRLTGRWATICGLPAHLGAGANVGGLSFATQAVLGAPGVARNDANTCCAQGEASVTKWPIPGNSRTVELVSVRAAIRATAVQIAISMNRTLRILAPRTRMLEATKAAAPLPVSGLRPGRLASGRGLRPSAISCQAGRRLAIGPGLAGPPSSGRGR